MKAGDELSINIEVSPHIEECYHHTLVSDEDGGIPMAQVTIELSASAPLTRIRVGIDAAEPLIVTRTSFIINSLSMYDQLLVHSTYHEQSHGIS